MVGACVGEIAGKSSPDKVAQDVPEKHYAFLQNYIGSVFALRNGEVDIFVKDYRLEQ